MKVRVRAYREFRGWFKVGKIYEATPIGNKSISIETEQGRLENFYNPYEHPSSCFEKVEDSPDDKFRELLLDA